MRFKLHDRVLHKPTGKPCFIVDIITNVDGSCSIALEAESQDDEDWFYWSNPDEIEKIPENA